MSQDKSEAAAIIAQVRPIAARIAHLSVEARIMLLCGLLTQEICTLPPGDRDSELRRVIDRLPGILDATEDGMRQALVKSAKGLR